jgi:DNA segregation ATPase FtsK/SpoIIIE, S-DNA-T family
MASFQARQRDPLLHQSTQAMLERRGRELLGLALLLLALGFAVILGSYSPEDPGWMVATEEPAQNMLGRFGAAVASTLTILIGLGAWAIPVILGVWGVRFMTHRGGERAVGRVVFAVIAVAFAAVQCATLVPGDGWTHTFGLGGLFGDTVLGSLIGVMPGSAGFGLKLLSLLTFAGLVVFMLYVTGFDMAELRAIRQFLFLGTVLGYNALASALGQGARGAVQGAMSLQTHARSRATAPAVTRDMPGVRRPVPPVTGAAMAPEPLRASQGRAMPSATRHDPAAFAEPVREKPSFLARLRRQPAPEPELVEPLAEAHWDAEAPSEDRIRARISDVIRARVQRVTDPMAAAPILRAEPPVMRPRGPMPLMADTRPLPRMAPPVTAAEPPLAAEEDDAFPANVFADDQAWDDADMGELGDDLPEPAPAYRSLGFAADRRAVVQHPAKKAAPSRQALAETQPGLRFDDSAPAYELPPLSLLSAPVAI